MRKWASAAAVVVALAFPMTALGADGPPEVYSDFAEDGVLSCGHSRSALKGVLNDASIYQYGDPLTFIGLKLAIRAQLAGGCRRRAERSATAPLFAATGSGEPSAPSDSPPTATRSSSGKATGRGAPPAEPEPIPLPETAAIAAGRSRDGRMVLVGVVLLLLTLASGGWAARRAFSD